MRLLNCLVRGFAWAIAIVFTAGCGTALQKADLEKPVGVIAEPWSVEVSRIAVDHGTARYGGFAKSHVVVEALFRNRSGATIEWNMTDARLELRRSFDAKAADKRLGLTTWAKGSMPESLQARNHLDAMMVIPPGDTQFWMAFHGDARAHLNQPYNVRMEIPVQRGESVSLALAAPGQGGPAWIVREDGAYVVALSVNTGLQIATIPGAEQVMNWNFLGQSFAAGNFVHEWATGVGNAIIDDDSSALSATTSYHLTRPFTWSSPRGLISVGPSLGLELHAFTAERQAVLGGRESRSRFLVAPMLGVTLLLDVPRPASSPFPLYIRPRAIGNQMALRLGYMRWFGTLEFDEPSPSWGSHGVGLQFRFAIAN